LLHLELLDDAVGGAPQGLIIHPPWWSEGSGFNMTRGDNSGELRRQVEEEGERDACAGAPGLVCVTSITLS
jgi:hypothetical protein